MLEVGFKGIGTYTTRRQNTVAQYIATRPILDLYKRYTRRQGVMVSLRWWQQDSLDLEGAKKKAEAAAAAESDGEETIGEEEGIPLDTTTVWELGWGYKVAT